MQPTEAEALGLGLNLSWLAERAPADSHRQGKCGGSHSPRTAGFERKIRQSPEVQSGFCVLTKNVAHGARHLRLRILGSTDGLSFRCANQWRGF